MLYKAFMSYSHAADGKLAPALHSALHKFAKPWYRLRSIRIFRDKTTLSVTPGLWPSIEAALSQSEYFILLVSPQAAESPWVQQEVAYWLGNAAADRLIVVQTGDDSVSESTTSLTPELRKVFQSQSAHLDLRWAKDEEHLSLRHPRFRQSVADLAATLHNRPTAEIVAEDALQQKRTRLLIRSAIISLLLLTLGAGALAFYANQQRNEALHRLGDSLMASAVQAGTNQEWLKARRIGTEAKDLFISQRRNTFAADLELLRSYYYAPLPLFAYLSPSSTMTFAPDRSHGLAVFGKTASLVDLKTMRVLNTYIEAPSDIARIWFSPKGDKALLEHPDHTLTVWHRDENRPTLVLSGLADTIHDAAISADGSLAATATEDGALTLWDLESGDILHRLAESTIVRAVAFTPDSQFVLSGSRSAEPPLAMWNAETGELVRSFRSRTREVTDSSVTSIAVSHDGRYALSGGSKLILWDIATGDELRLFRFSHVTGIFQVGFSEDGSLVLASAGMPEMTTSVWLTESGALQYSFPGTSFSIRDLSLSPRGATLMLHDDKQNYLSVIPEEKRPVGLGTRQGSIKQVEFSPDSRILVSIDNSGGHAVWDVATGHQLKSLPLDGQKLTRVRFHPNENKLVYGDNDGAVGAIDLGSSTRSMSFDAHPNAVTDLALSPDGQRVLTIGAEKTAKLWNLGTGTLDRAIELESVPRNVSFLPDNEAAVIASDEGLWSLNVHAGTLDLITAERGTTGYAFNVSSDGHACTSGGRAPAAFELNYWDLTQREKIRSLAGHEFGISQCDISPDGAWLVSAGYDRTIRFWETDTGKQLPVIEPQESIRSIRYSPDGRYIAVGTASGHFTWHLAAREEYESFTPGIDRAIDTLAKDPDHLASLELLARWYAFRELWTWSAELFEEVRRAGGEFPSLPLAQAYWSLGRYDDAWQEFQRAIERQEAPAYYLRMCQRTMELLRSRERIGSTP